MAARFYAKAAEAGKHVIIEKPIANSLDEMRAMRDAVRKAGVKTVVSFVLRWNPLFETPKSLIADDAFGEVYYVETDYQSNVASSWGGYEDARKKVVEESKGRKRRDAKAQRDPRK